MLTILQAFAGTAVAVLLHECGHITSALLFGVEVKEMGFNRTGMYVRRARAGRHQNILIALAGPLANALLAFACWKVNPQFALINAMLAVFNLLPIPNSDGSRALEAL